MPDFTDRRARLLISPLPQGRGRAHEERRAALVVGDEVGRTEAVVTALPGGARSVRVGDYTCEVRLERSGDEIRVERDRSILRGTAVVDGCRVLLHLVGEDYAVEVLRPFDLMTSEAATGAGSGAVVAPMPGVVAEIRVEAGESVKVGQVVAVLESMKLFMSLEAEIAGTVTDVACRPGETVPAGQTLVRITAAERATEAEAAE